jgi:putative ABC transport system permease protein
MRSPNFKFTVRTLWRNRFYSLLNIGGLAGGILASVLILVFVAHEFSFDQFHPESEKIYQLGGKFKFGEQEINVTGMSAGMGPRLKESTAGVKEYARIYNLSFERLLVASDREHRFYETNIAVVDPTYFKLFSFPLINGQSPRPLQKGQVLISEKLAKKYFGDSDVNGRSLRFGDKVNLQVAGVLQNPPSNSTLKHEIYAGMNDLKNLMLALQSYNDDIMAADGNKIRLGSFQTYFKLADAEVANSVLKNIPLLMRADKMPEEEIKSCKHSLMPLHDLHLNNSSSQDSVGVNNLYIFAGVALLILFLALLNYVSLTTARATERAREVGVRKALGAVRGTLMGQFYGESIVITGVAFAIGFGLAFLFRNAIFELLNLQIDARFFFSSTVWVPLSILMLACLGLAGAYPSFVLSEFRPAEVLKGTLASSKMGGQRVRQSITVFQFAASIALIICGLVVQKQVKYLQGRDLGMQKDQVLMVRPDTSGLKAFRNEVMQVPGVEKTALASMALFKDGYGIFFDKSPFNQRDLSMMTLSGDLAFIELMGLKWARQVLGAKDSKALQNTLLINEKAAKEMGLPDDLAAISKYKVLGAPIGGVLKDFHFSMEGINAQMPSMALFMMDENAKDAVVYMRLAKGANLIELVEKVETLYQKHCPGVPFEYSFLDQNFNAQYRAEARLGNLFSIFTGFAILISCLGLLGLAAYATSRRTKEIGIRKVLGASVSGIVTLLSVDFLKPVLVATILGSVPAWYLMGRWLEKFSYRTELDWRIFAFAALAALVVAVVTVSMQSVKAALANPVKAIKSE